MRFPPFTVSIRSPIPVVRLGLSRLYADYELAPEGDRFVDFHVEVARARRWPRPQCVFRSDGLEPFTPLGQDEAFALLEWGLNWCITGYSHTWLTVHSAVLEREGHALLLPAPPGSGKSTLCAGLMLDGWRLLSDEMALMEPDSRVVVPSPRPISLKNKSIEVIRTLSPATPMGPVALDTLKGTVAHLKPSGESIQRAQEPGRPSWIVFPRYESGAASSLTPRGKASAFMQLAENSFNQHAHGRAGFQSLGSVVDQCDCYDFVYSELSDAFRVFRDLVPPG
jgi:HprK-related kinase A